jgi:hypothetical protein
VSYALRLALRDSIAARRDGEKRRKKRKANNKKIRFSRVTRLSKCLTQANEHVETFFNQFEQSTREREMTAEFV